MQQDNVISVLIGLVGACNNNPKRENTDKVVLTALAFPACGYTESEVIAQIRAEKNVISPDCATCATPCGNTSDYDMSRIYNAEPAVRDLKQQVLTEICQFATCAFQKGVTLTEESTSLLYKALAYVGYDVSVQTLRLLLAEIQQTKLPQ